MTQQNNRESSPEPTHQETNQAGKSTDSALPPSALWQVFDWLRKALRGLKPEAITAWATVALVVVTIVLAIVAFFTLRSNSKTTQVSERAYVFAAPGNVFNLYVGGSRLQVYVLIDNSGKTFARITERRIGANILGPPIPDKIEGLGEMQSEIGQPVAWPHQPQVVIRTLGQLEEKDVRQIMNGEKLIYVFGKIRYEDVWRSPHETTFCHMYSGQETTPMPPYKKPGYAGTQAKYCEKYNDADANY